MMSQLPDLDLGPAVGPNLQHLAAVSAKAVLGSQRHPGLFADPHRAKHLVVVIVVVVAVVMMCGGGGGCGDVWWW